MRLFFPSARSFMNELTALYDFVNPTAASMWNLRWQVRGYVDVAPDATTVELHDRFVRGSGIRSANVRRHCIEQTWDEQMNQLSLFCLIGAIGTYESWLASLEIGTQEDRKRLQFPATSRRKGATDIVGVRWVVLRARQNLAQSIPPALATCGFA